MQRARLTILALAALLACAGERDAGPRPLNVVVITLDTTRTDALGAYGQALPVTPRIDALAGEGVLFEQVLTATPSTLPSHATLFTGLQPFSHGVRSNIGYRLSEESDTLAERLAAEGWDTAAEIAAPVLRAGKGLEQGFARYARLELALLDALEVIKDKPFVRLSRPAEDVTGGALFFLRMHLERPFFLWLHYFDAHIPLAPPEPFASRFEDPYLAEVSRVDHQVGLVIDEIQRLGLRDRTLVVLTADHGEGRGDHGEQTHAYYVYDSTMRVPLVFWGADLPRGVRVESLVRLADVSPTLLDLLGLPPLEDVEGVSLRPLFDDPERDLGLTGYGESIEWRQSFGGDVLRFVREGRWKYLHKLEPALYDVLDDPGETRNLAAEQPEVVARLGERLGAVLAAAGEAPGDVRAKVSAEELAQLRALGYAAGASEEGSVSLDSLELSGPDPDRRAVDLDFFVRAMANVADGQWDDAERRFRWVLRRNPLSPPVLLGLADSLLATGQEEEAVELLRRLVEVAPDQPGYVAKLARVLVARGELTEAERELRRALALEPCFGGARLHLSQLLRGGGLRAERIAVLEEGVAACPEDLVSRNALAYALATEPDPSLRDGARAVSLAESVVAETGDENPDHIDTLAAAYAAAGDLERAVTEQRRAVALIEGRDLAPQLVEPLREHLESFESGEALRIP